VEIPKIPLHFISTTGVEMEALTCRGKKHWEIRRKVWKGNRN